MTSDRWDTRGHEDDDPHRKRPNGKPYDPWHDATTALEGPVAAALGELARDRWKCAGGDELQPVEGRSDCWPEGLPCQFTDVAVAISRTRPENARGCPRSARSSSSISTRSPSAERHIYAESQYFASRRIAEAIAGRLERAGRAGDRPGQSDQRRRLAGAGRDGYRPGAALSGPAPARPAWAPAPLPSLYRGRRADLRPRQDPGRRRHGSCGSDRPISTTARSASTPNAT